MIAYPCHLFAVQTKDRERRFDITKFSDACLCRKFGVVEPLRSPIIDPNKGQFDSIRFSTSIEFRKFGAIETTLFVVYLNDIRGTMDRSQYAENTFHKILCYRTAPCSISVLGGHIGSTTPMSQNEYAVQNLVLSNRLFLSSVLNDSLPNLSAFLHLYLNPFPSLHPSLPCIHPSPSQTCTPLYTLHIPC